MILPDGSTFANAVSLNAANAALSTLQMGTNTLSGAISGSGFLTKMEAAGRS
jgi:hypothetical protein